MIDDEHTLDAVDVLRMALQHAGILGEAAEEGEPEQLLIGLAAREQSFNALSGLLTLTDTRLWTALLRVAAQEHPLHRTTEPERALHGARELIRAAFAAPGPAPADAARDRVLLAGLRSADERVRCLAAELLGRRGDPEFVEALARLQHDPNDHVRAAAIRALAILPTTAVIPHLLSVLERYDVVDAEAVSGLVRVGEPAVVPLLRELQSRSAWARYHATKALGGIRDPRAVQPLIAALSDDDSSVRWEAANALAAIGPAVLDPLLKTLVTGNVTPWFAESARRVINRVATGDLYAPVAHLQHVLHHVTAAIEVPIEAARARDRLQALQPA